MEIIKLLEEWQIAYDLLEHEPVYTVAESESLGIAGKLSGMACKNLFLRSKKGHYYLLVLPAKEKADLKYTAKILGLSRLSFASEEDLQNVLGLYPGSVTPLGVLNDEQNLVTVIFSEALQGKRVLFHPNCNTATAGMAFEDVLQVLARLEHKWLMLPAEVKQTD